MSDKMKYITYKDTYGDAFIMFNIVTAHNSHHIDRDRILGAGFVRLIGQMDRYDEVTIKFDCYGHSESLDIKSRGELDSNILNRSKQDIGCISKKE